jgi:hypothetical protein
MFVLGLSRTHSKFSLSGLLEDSVDICRSSMRFAGVFLRMGNFRDHNRRFQNVTKSCSRVLSLLGDHSLFTGVGTGWLTNGCDGANGLSQAGGPKALFARQVTT